MSTQEFKIDGKELYEKVKELIQKGNARKISIKKESGETILEIPLTLGAVGAIIAPVLAAVGALAALLTKCSIVVEKRDDVKPEEKTEAEPTANHLEEIK